MEKIIKLTVLVLMCLSISNAMAQKLPEQFHYSEDGKRLIIGGIKSTGFYNESTINKIYLDFEQADFWEQMLANYDDKIDILATMTYEGEVLDSVGVRFKGQTSYNKSGDSKKKSFNITLDYAKKDQNIDGYETLNLNNAYEDASFLHEVLYLNLSRKHIPSVKANYVELFINGESWGLYPNVQQLNSKHAGEWFLDDDATRWRCEASVRLSRENRFGAGVSSINYLGTDTNEYRKYYTIKNNDEAFSWGNLMDVCDRLNNVPLAELEDSLRLIFDVDGALWYIAHELIFLDDDGYVNKGGMDYYVYYDVATGRLRPIEYDGNSCMNLQKLNTWTLFYKQKDERFPLMNRLLAVPELRQRYLAHVRTILNESFGNGEMQLIDDYVTVIEPLVMEDTKKFYTNKEFTSGVDEVKTFFTQRAENLWQNAELLAQGISITNVKHLVNGEPSMSPDENQAVTVSAQITNTDDLREVKLYYGTGFMGSFQRVAMMDDATNGDKQAGDGIYTGTIPKQPAGTYVRYYIESVADNEAGTCLYEPAGAEHDVYIYRVNIADLAERTVVINEIMASNNSTVMDAAGEYDDWIELYNPGPGSVDLSGYYLTDNPLVPDKWSFPQGTSLESNAYLIVWADKDEDQQGLHAGFKLSSEGESVILFTPDLKIADEITFTRSTSDLSLARLPNGEGEFVNQIATFSEDNSFVSLINEKEVSNISIWPNPSSNSFNISLGTDFMLDVTIYNVAGNEYFKGTIRNEAEFDISTWPSGFYLIQVGNQVEKLMIRH